MAKRISFVGIKSYYAEEPRASVTGAWFKKRVEYFYKRLPNRKWAELFAGKFTISFVSERERGRLKEMGISSNYKPGLIKTMKKIDKEVNHIMEINHVGRRVALKVYWDEVWKRYQLQSAGVPLEQEMDFMHAWLGDALYPEDE